MKRIVLAALAAALALGISSAQAQYGMKLYGTGSKPSSTYVAPHTTSNGTYVSGHQRTTPNTTQLDNYGTKGNVNPYTGATGSRYGRY
ncbi:MAG: hypothetical protein IT537_08545 [Hyphomicrobiales bacterium]|nr:hypothetical protein [Hyphomicrobiales bacterium]